MKKNNLLLCLIAAAAMSVGGSLATAQTADPFNGEQLRLPSAQSWQMAHYGSLTPSLVTGAMEYTQEVYTYSDPDFNLPISLCYHFDGYRPNANPDILGLGWRLQAGGCITREVHGLPDELCDFDRDDQTDVYGYWFYAQRQISRLTNYNLCSISMTGDWLSSSTPEAADGVCVFSDNALYLPDYGQNGVNSERFDHSPDIFSFSAGDMHGKFVIMPDGDVKAFDCNCPDDEIMVSLDFEPYSGINTRSRITIVDGRGYTFVFGGSMSALEYSVSRTPESLSTSISAWRLISITAPNGRRLVFEYSTSLERTVSSSRMYSASRVVDLRYVIGNYPWYSHFGVHTAGIQRIIGMNYHAVLESIKVDGWQLASFNYAVKEHDDCAGECFFPTLTLNMTDTPVELENHRSDSPRRLVDIEIRDNGRHLIEKATLGHTYIGYGSPTYKMLLSEVCLSSVGTYSFDYVDEMQLPYNDTAQTDHWGYWNVNGVFDLVNHIDYDSIRSGNLLNQICDGIKDSDFERSVQSGLRKITYPTGGSTNIEYGPNQASSMLNRDASGWGVVDTLLTNCGGVRVKMLVDESGGRRDTTMYVYSKHGESRESGMLMDTPRYAMPITCSYYFGLWSTSSDDPVISAFNVHVPVYTVGFTSDCNVGAITGNHVLYSCVQAVRPDGSVTETVFTGWDDYPDTMPQESQITSHIRYCYSLNDYVYDIAGELPFIRGVLMPAAGDYCSLRGRVKRENQYDSEGTLTSFKEVEYTARLVGETSRVCNMLVEFDEIPLYLISANVVQTQETACERNGDISIVKSSVYDAGGHLVSQTELDRQSGASFRTEYSYDSVYKSSIQSMKKWKGNELIRHRNYVYEYDRFNPQPIRIENREGYPYRTTDIDYNDLLRPVRIDYPGGRWTQYLWSADGRYLLGSTSNDTSNTTSYTWQDLVGLTSVTLPSGQSESYTYDSKGRLSERKDSDGERTVSYEYKPVNEE